MLVLKQEILLFMNKC
ncbi:Protein of unknown function [Bacillus mycoides]|nr:Protein of unknown function [Bacillus mycoides]